MGVSFRARTTSPNRAGSAAMVPPLLPQTSGPGSSACAMFRRNMRMAGLPGRRRCLRQSSAGAGICGSAIRPMRSRGDHAPLDVGTRAEAADKSAPSPRRLFQEHRHNRRDARTACASDRPSRCQATPDPAGSPLRTPAGSAPGQYPPAAAESWSPATRARRHASNAE